MVLEVFVCFFLSCQKLPCPAVKPFFTTSCRCALSNPRTPALAAKTLKTDNYRLQLRCLGSGNTGDSCSDPAEEFPVRNDRWPRPDVSPRCTGKFNCRCCRFVCRCRAAGTVCGLPLVRREARRKARPTDTAAGAGYGTLGRCVMSTAGIRLGVSAGIGQNCLWLRVPPSVGQNELTRAGFPYPPFGEVAGAISYISCPHIAGTQPGRTFAESLKHALRAVQYVMRERNA